MEEAIIELLKEKLNVSLSFSNNILKVKLSVDCDYHYDEEKETYVRETVISEDQIDLTDINPGMDYT